MQDILMEILVNGMLVMLPICRQCFQILIMRGLSIHVMQYTFIRIVEYRTTRIIHQKIRWLFATIIFCVQIIAEIIIKDTRINTINYYYNQISNVN